MFSSTMTSRPLRFASAGVLALCLYAFASPPTAAQPAGSEGSEADQPNILWITAEDIGPALGAYGDDEARTPHLDQLAEQGVLYQSAYATAPICAPSRSSPATGMYATTLGTQHLRSQIPVPDSLRILAEILRRRGYHTTHHWKTDYNFSAEGRWDVIGPNERCCRRLGGKPFFSVVSVGHTHEGSANSPGEEVDSLLAGLERRHEPQTALLPPPYPDTPEMRRIWAGYYDLITLMDRRVGELVARLKENDQWQNTIVFFFSDHGFGMPRYKRWLNRGGLRVPLIVRVPPKYRRPNSDVTPGRTVEVPVSLVDMAPTVLSLIGAPIPERMQGVPFLGPRQGTPRDYAYGARSRADDVYDMSRAVVGERYMYVRNYMPHRPYIPRAIIFGDQKASYRELRRLRAAGRLNEAARQLFAPKPPEELYDLQEDPYGLNNLADAAQHQQVKKQLRARLRGWILRTRDTGFLHEAEMMIRSEGSTPYQMAQDPAQYPLARILNTAELVGDSTARLPTLTRKIEADDAGVRFWAAEALLARVEQQERSVDEAALEALASALEDPAPSVQIVTAEALCDAGRCAQARPVLAERLQDAERPWVVLHAARTLQNIGTKARPLLPLIRRVRERYGGDIWGRYRSWSYPMFIGFALDQTLMNLGATPPGVTSAQQ